MRLARCEQCGATVLETAAACPRCEFAQKRRFRLSSQAIAWLAVGALAGAVAMVLVSRSSAIVGSRDTASTGDPVSSLSVPIKLDDELISVSAGSLRGVPIQVPYAGQLRLEIVVPDGEPISTNLIDLDGWETYLHTRAKPPNSLDFSHSAFQSQSVAHVEGKGRLSKGVYVVALESAPPGDHSFNVKVQAWLEP